VTHTRYDGMIHAFVSLYTVIDQGRVALGQCTDALRDAFTVR
jgi:acetyl esterase/lipase